MAENYPEDVLEAVRRAEAAHPGDPGAAVEAADAAVRGLPSYRGLVDRLVTDAVAALVYAARHRANVQIKREAGRYGRPAPPARREAVEASYASVFAYRIGGTVLGELTGGQLGALKAKIDAQISGHVFNRELIEWCRRRGVPADRTVAESVPEREVRRAFRDIWVRTYGAEPPQVA